MTGILDIRRILVLEDDYLIALDIGESLEEFGAEVVGPVGRLPEAEDLVARERIDGAILDINIGGSTSYPVARRLIEAGVPVMFMTGYAPENVDAEFSGIRCLPKPFDAGTFQRHAGEVFAAA